MDRSQRFKVFIQLTKKWDGVLQFHGWYYDKHTWETKCRDLQLQPRRRGEFDLAQGGEMMPGRSWACTTLRYARRGLSSYIHEERMTSPADESVHNWAMHHSSLDHRIGDQDACLLSFLLVCWKACLLPDEHPSTMCPNGISQMIDSNRYHDKCKSLRKSEKY